MPYRRKKIRRTRISTGDIKVYLFISLLCALVAMALVLAIELFTEKVPAFVEVLESEAVRQTAERITGKKLDDARLKRLKRAYKDKEIERDLVREFERIRGKKLDRAAVERLRKAYKDTEKKKR